MISDIGQTNFTEYVQRTIPDYFSEEKCQCQEIADEIENKKNCQTKVFFGITIFLQSIVIVSEIYILYLALKLQ